MHSTPSVPSPTRRYRIVVVACIAVITALAWAYLIYLGRQTSSSTDSAKAMAAMGGGGASASGAGGFTTIVKSLKVNTGPPK